MNFKEALRKDTNYLRGLSYLDAKLRQNWINQNAARLRQARDLLTTDDYKTFAEDLYHLQMWNNLEAENISKGVYGPNFKPTREYVKDYFNKKVADIDFTLKYHPDLDENNVYVGSKKNTGLSPEMWNIYSNLKDEQAKKEFRDNIKTEDALRKEAEDLTWNNYLTRAESAATAVGGDLSSEKALSGLITQKLTPKMAKFSPNTREYYNDNAGTLETKQVNSANAEKAQNIWSRSLKRYRNSPEYKKALNSELTAISNKWNSEAAKDKNGAEKAHKDEFLEAIKDNPVLMAASGYDPKTGKFSHEQFKQYETLLNEDPDFKARYVAHRNVLAKQVQEGLISEDDYRQSLIDIANDSLKDHEGFLTRAANAGSAAVTTGMTYTLHKFAPFVNTIEVLKKRTDGKVFIDAHGNIYQDSDIASNAQYTNPKDADSAVLYKTSNGISINYNRDGDKIFVKDGVSYIYQNEDGSFRAVDPNSVDANDEHLRKVNAINVKNTSIGTHDLVRLSKDDSGNDLNWAGGAFNEKYLQLADRYNIAPFTWNHDEMDYYNQFGYSKYVNIQRPGDDSRDFWGETIKMMGFVGADLLMAFATRGIGKLGGAVGMGMKTMRGIELGTGLMGAVGIADSYAQGVFEENLARNEQTLQNIISEKAKAKAEDWANTEGKELLNQMYAEAEKTQEKELGRPLTETEKAQVQMAVRAQAVGARAMQHYAEDIQHPDVLKMQEKAVEEAGNAAIVDFWGEGLKYGIVNTLGFRSWMFKSRNAAEQAARASEKTLFGKRLSRVGIATQADVDAKLAEKVGDVYLKEAWSKMSKTQKARRVLEIIGKQAWEGAWTNWTDEMQSAGARAQNNSNFDAHLNNNTPSGAYLFANAIASQLQGIQKSVFDPNSLWAGLIGGAGSVLGFGFNPMGIVEAVTNKQSWNRMSTGEKFNSIFSNSVLSNVYQNRANDYQAQQMLDRANALLKSVDGNTISIINSLQSTSRIGHSENPIEAEEADVTNLFHTLLAVDNFSKTNPGLAELDALSNIRNFAENAEKLSDISKLSDEEKQGYIEQIKVSNPNMTEAEATAELENVSKRATLMKKMISDWTDLQNSEEYKRASSEDIEGKTPMQENMEQRLELQALQDYTLQNMREREQKIKGSTSIDIIDDINTPIAKSTFDGKETTYRAQETELLATFGNTKRALKNIKESYKILAFNLEQRKSNMEKAQANLNFEEQAEALKEQINNTISPTEKQDLEKKLEDLVDDNKYYTSEIAKLENELNENADQQARLEALFARAIPDSEIILSARDILNLDPIARMRMLDPDNFDNYNRKQQTQIKKANAELSKNGLDFSDIQNQALAFSRYAQREGMLDGLANNETVSPSFRTTVTNMIDAAKKMIDSNIKQHAKRTMKEINNDSSIREEAIAKKYNFLRTYSPSALRYIKDSLNKEDQRLIDEILPMAETGEQLIDLIHNENYGLTGLNIYEKINLHSAVADAMSQSRTAEELIDNLATKSVDTLTPSINTLLDKLGQVYEQQHSTIVETAKEKAQRQANERRAAQVREQAAQAAVAPAETAPSVSPTPTTETPATETSTTTTRKGEKQLKRGFDNLKNTTDPIEKGNAIANIESNVYAGAEITAEEKATLEQAKQELAAQGYEVVDMLGKPYNDGMKVSAQFIADETAPVGSQTITRILKPQINKNGVMTQAAEIVVILGPEKAVSLTETKDKTPEQLIHDAKQAILDTQAQVQPTAERDPHADHYLINGEKYTRVHGAMGDVWVGSNSPNKESNLARSLKNGSIVDGIVRDFFNGITPAKPDHFSDEAFASLMTSLETIKAKIKENGEEFLTNNIVLYHKFPNGVKIAGEADIVSIKIVDGKPQYNIYDLKTSAGGRDGKAFNESPFWETNPTAGARNTVIGTREQYTNQVSLYKLLFERMLNTPVTNLALLPYKLTYDAENNVTGIEKYPGIALTYNPNVEKLIAYQPAIDEAISRIQHTYEGMFTKEQLATIKGIIVNGIIKNESFAKDFKKFFESQGLPEFYEIEGAKFNPIIKDLKEAISSIDVAETLKEEFKEPEPLPTPTPPAELATVEPTGIEYSPTKESFTEPDVDAEFNVVGEDAGSTQLQQPQNIVEEYTDADLSTNAIENIDINKETGEVAATIKGNPMSIYVYEDKTKGIADEDKRDAKRGILVLKTPDESMQNYNKWMQSRKIDLQGLIDDKLSDILSTGTNDNPVKLFFMRVNPKMTATGGHLMNSHYLLVVEDTPALRRVYTQADADKYGDFVTANGKQYLIVGTAGFANSSQGKAYRRICTSDSPNSVKSKSEAYFKSNANEEFYVDPDKYTHVARIHSGFIIKQLATDSMPKVRRISELLNDPERNPHGLTWDSLVFGYQMRNGFRTIPESDPLIYRWPAKAMHNIGNVFVYIKGTDGRYTPAMLTPTRYLEISPGTLKTEIDNALRMLTSLDHAQRYKGLLALYNLVVLGQKDNNGVITGTDILIGTDKVPSLTFMLNGKEVYSTKNLQNVDFQEVLTGFGRLNPRISVTKSKLLSEEALKKLDAAGALRTDIARLGKASGDYAVYNIGSDGKPIITAAPITSSNADIVRGGARRIRVDEQYYSKMGDKYINEEGNIITDDILLESIRLNDFILNTNMDASITIGTTEYFVPNMNDNQGIIAREVGTHRAHIVTGAVQINSVKQAIQNKIAEEAQASRDAAASAELEGVTPIVETAPDISTEQAPKTPTDPISSVMDLLNMDIEKEKPVTPNSTPTASESSTSSQDINITERKSLIDADNSVKNGTFAGEKDAFSIIQDETFQDAVLDECERLWPETADMGFGEIVEFLKSKGKVTTGIKDVKTWIDTLKC